jgi:hypothetical protein
MYFIIATGYVFHYSHLLCISLKLPVMYFIIATGYVFHYSYGLYITLYM